MIKTHNKTGLKYLCQTKRKDPIKYTGSGSYWKLHLKNHGYDFSTEFLGIFEDFESLEKNGIYYSNLYKVVESEEWANLVEENGTGGDTSKTKGYIEGMKNRRRYNGKNNPNYGKPGSWTGKVGPMKGKIWYNNGKIEILTEFCPEGFVQGRLTFLCENCNRCFDNLNYKRFHGDNCKFKIE